MTAYTITYDLTHYRVGWRDGSGDLRANYRTSMAAVMQWLAHRIVPGDTITWEATGA
jgi:hypothetical protein